MLGVIPGQSVPVGVLEGVLLAVIVGVAVILGVGVCVYLIIYKYNFYQQGINGYGLIQKLKDEPMKLL